MKVLLVNPPADHEISANNPEVIESSRGFTPPLGILYLAAVVERDTPHEIRVIDAQEQELTHEELTEKIVAEAPDVLGLTAMTFTIIDVMIILRNVRERLSNTQFILGGPHVHIYPLETINIPEVDVAIHGEGEGTIAELLECIGDKQAMRNCVGIMFKDENGEVVNTGKRPLIDDLDSLPFPARHLTNWKRYSSVMAKRDPITTMFTSRGCPYKCSFCDRPNLGKNFRARSAQSIVDEMELCQKELGIHEFFIYDDTFTIDKKRVVATCEEIKRRKLDIGWDFRARTNTVTPELLKLLRSSGCERIHYGVEVPNDRLMRVLKKGLKVDSVVEAFRETRKAGIETLAYFMIGVPTQSKEEVYETFEFMKKLDPDFVHLTILTPFPATQIYYQGMQQGLIEKDYWREFAQNPTTEFEPPYWTEILSREELHQGILDGYRSFYVRPSYILRKTMKVRSWGEFMSQGQGRHAHLQHEELRRRPRPRARRGDDQERGGSGRAALDFLVRRRRRRQERQQGREAGQELELSSRLAFRNASTPHSSARFLAARGIFRARPPLRVPNFMKGSPWT